MTETGKLIQPLNELTEIKKSKAFINATTSPGNLPIPAQRLFLALLSYISPDTTEDTFIIKGKDLANLADLSPNVVGQQLEEMSEKADALRAYTLVIREDDGNDLRVGLISSTKYLKGQRAIRVKVDQYLMPYLQQMKEQYVISYPAGGPMKFRSEYSIRLYDMMVYYLNQENGYHYYTKEEVRKLFNIPDGKIPLTSTLNQRVITPAIRDINNYTHLNVELKMEKRGHTIVGYHFFVENKEEVINNCVLKIEEKKASDEEFVLTLISPPYNFNKVVLYSLMEKYGIESIKNNFKYTQGKNPKNFSKYLYWSINHQVYEKEKEAEQIHKINSRMKLDVPVPVYSETKPSSLFNDEDMYEVEKTSFNPEKLKDSNPKLYQQFLRINKILKEKEEQSKDIESLK